MASIAVCVVCSSSVCLHLFVCLYMSTCLCFKVSFPQSVCVLKWLSVCLLAYLAVSPVNSLSVSISLCSCLPSAFLCWSVQYFHVHHLCVSVFLFSLLLPEFVPGLAGWHNYLAKFDDIVISTREIWNYYMTQFGRK